MPGRQVKSWKRYHRLRQRGYSKPRAAKIVNSGKRGSRKGGKRSR